MAVDAVVYPEVVQDLYEQEKTGRCQSCYFHVVEGECFHDLHRVLSLAKLQNLSPSPYKMQAFPWSLLPFVLYSHVKCAAVFLSRFEVCVEGDETGKGSVIVLAK